MGADLATDVKEILVDPARTTLVPRAASVLLASRRPSCSKSNAACASTGRGFGLRAADRP